MTKSLRQTVYPVTNHPQIRNSRVTGYYLAGWWFRLSSRGETSTNCELGRRNFLIGSHRNGGWAEGFGSYCNPQVVGMTWVRVPDACTVGWFGVGSRDIRTVRVVTCSVGGSGWGKGGWKCKHSEELIDTRNVWAAKIDSGTREEKQEHANQNKIHEKIKLRINTSKEKIQKKYKKNTKKNCSKAQRHKARPDQFTIG